MTAPDNTPAGPYRTPCRRNGHGDSDPHRRVRRDPRLLLRERWGEPVHVTAAGMACVPDIGMDDGYCDRFVADLTRRVPLTADQSGPAESAKRAVELALSGNVLNRCNIKHEPCDTVTAWGDEPATPQEVRPRLATLTLHTPEVRQARPDDPAVTNSVLSA
jgi:hypothetical protein